MEGWVDLGYPVMHQPGVELVISRSQVRCPNHYSVEPPVQQHHLTSNLWTVATVSTVHLTNVVAVLIIRWHRWKWFRPLQRIRRFLYKSTFYLLTYLLTYLQHVTIVWTVYLYVVCHTRALAKAVKWNEMPFGRDTHVYLRATDQAQAGHTN